MNNFSNKTIAMLVSLTLVLGSFSNAYAAGSLITVSPAVVNTYLSNPGIGWQSDGSSVNIPETISYPYRPTITWAILNPSNGTYNWSILDTKINEATAAGKQISFRIATMMGEGYGGHAVPAWVVSKGAVILSSGEPDYSNCVYQEEWGNFVTKMIQRYDGNPAIAFIDISGYGNFNEWSWQSQTQWDSVWDTAYSSGKASPTTMMTIDSQARRRLADIFIGGSISNHQCKTGSTVSTVSYTYAGAQNTQLVMPNAGINQSTQYVVTRRPDVGFRYDCLGRTNTYLTSNEVKKIWKSAPVVYEFCGPNSFDLTLAQTDIKNTHGSVVHNNGSKLTAQSLQQFMLQVGYRYHLKQAQFNSQLQNQFSISMTWQNIGNAPAYPKMGQNFKLHVYLVDSTGKTAADYPITSDLSKWMPADPSTAPDNLVNATLSLPQGISAGQYSLKVSVIDQRTNKPIQLAFTGADTKGMYLLSAVTVVPSNQTPVAATSTATIVVSTLSASPTPTKTATVVTPTKTATVVTPTKTATVITPTKTATVVTPTKTATVVTPSKTATAITPTKTSTPMSSPIASVTVTSQPATLVSTATKTAVPTITNTATAGETTITFQPDATSGVDTFINDSANYGTTGYMGIGENDNQTNYYARSLIKFDLSSIPANATITSVTLSLWTTQDLSSNDRNIRIYRLKKSFVESQATWNLSAAGVNWQSPGASGANDHEGISIGSTLILANDTINAEKQISIDPARVQEMVSGAFVNNGFIIIADTELNDRFNYKTSDSGTGSQRPKLVIRYIVNGAAGQFMAGPSTATATSTNTSIPATMTATATPIIIPSETPTSTLIQSSPTVEMIIPTETPTP